MEHLGTKSIETERLILRKYRPSDAEAMFFGWANDPGVTEHLTWQPHKDIDVSKTLIDEWIKGYEKPDKYLWAIVLKKEDKAIGSFGIHFISDRDRCGEMGYCIGKDYWNMGLMSEAVKAVIDFCFNDVNFNRLEAMHSVKNPASGAVMKKCGMVKEGTLRKRLKNHQGVFVDCDLYGVIKDDLK